MSRRQIGGYEFNAEIVNIRNAANEILNCLEQMLAGNLGTQTIVAYAARMIRQVGIILNAVNTVADFGEQIKSERTK